MIAYSWKIIEKSQEYRIMNEYKILITNQEELIFLLNSYQLLCIGLYIFNLYLDYKKLRIFVTNELVCALLYRRLPW